MRLQLDMELGKREFPIDYRRIFLSYIKNALSKYHNGDAYEKFFKNTNSKDYCFTIIFQSPKYQKDKIILEGRNLKVLLSVDDRNKSDLILFSALISQKNITFPLSNGNTMVLKNIIQKREQLITSSKAIFKITVGSGLCIRLHDRLKNKDTYFVYNDKDFAQQFNMVVSEQAIKAGFRKEDIQNIKFKPVQCKKVVAKHFGVYVDLTVGMFAMEATPQLLQYFYNAGLGSRHSQGFGMVDLITQDML